MPYKTGGERGPVILVAFKAIDPALRESGGGFDSHTLPPKLPLILWVFRSLLDFSGFLC